MADLHSGLNAAADALGLWNHPRDYNRIVAHYFDVASTAASQKRGRNPLIDRSEYEAAALRGLWDAARRFDPSSAAKFTTFSTLRIWGEMGECERQADHLPAKVRQDAKRNGTEEVLPVLFGLQDADADLIPAPEPAEPQSDDLSALLASTDPRAAEILRAAVSVGLDHKKLARHLGVTSDRAHDLYVAALESARLGTPFNPPTELRVPEYRDRTAIIAIMDCVSRGIDTRSGIEAAAGVNAGKIPRLLQKMSDNGWGTYQQTKRGNLLAISIEPSGVAITL